MQIEWSEEEAKDARQKGDAANRNDGACLLSLESVRAIASRAVELYLTRASGQVAEDDRTLSAEIDAHEMPDDYRGYMHAAISRLSALAQEAEALRASADELQRQRDSRGEALEVAEQEIKTLRAKMEALVKESALFERHLYAARDERDVARSEVKACRASDAHLKGVIDGLIAEAKIKEEITEMRAKSMWGARVQAAESRLSSIRERAAQAIAECRGEGAREILRERLGWVLEGDVSNPSMPSNGSGKDGHASTPGQCSNPDPTTGPTCAERGCEGRECRYPCSPTCTHDDAAKPGHPERVKDRSEAIKRISSDECEHNVDYRDTCGDCEYERGKEQGAEAMRAACWEAVREVLQSEGYSEGGPSWMFERFKAAIHGAKP